MVVEGYWFMKVFMIYEDLCLLDVEILKVFDVVCEISVMVMVYCENEDVIWFLIEKYEVVGNVVLRVYVMIWLIVVEWEVLYCVFFLVEIVGVLIVIVYVLNGEVMEEISCVWVCGLKVIGEICL